MFDDIPIKEESKENKPEAKKDSAEDMFADLELNPPPAEGDAKPKLDESAKIEKVEASSGLRILMYILVGVIVVGVVILAIVMVLGKFNDQQSGKIIVQPKVEQKVLEDKKQADVPIKKEDKVQPVDNKSKIIFPVDTDNDGLNDSFEKEKGTDPNKIDSDMDGLSDYQEIMEYMTDPLSPDTDGDGFSDGQEVNNGYNPLGGGKL